MARDAAARRAETTTAPRFLEAEDNEILLNYKAGCKLAALAVAAMLAAASMAEVVASWL